MTTADPAHAEEGVATAFGQPGRAYEATKRTLDISGALVGLTISGPILLLCAAVIKLDDFGPIVHKRLVLGRGGRRFPAYKLRTMIVDADKYIEERPDLVGQFEKTFKLRTDPRVTRVGKWLRKLSLDELPQLVNVLRGEMSLVGPRMISPAELDKYGIYGDRLLTVKPGLTGLWQVSGRQEADYAERISLDMEYIERRSLRLDLRILAQTIPALLLGRGAY